MISSPTKLAMFAFLLIVSVFVTIPAFPFQNEPEGFRGIKWGTNIAEFKDIELVESSKDTNYFRRKSDKMKIGDADIAEISYGFYKNRFYVVFVEYKGFLNFTKLKAILLNLYGKPLQPNQFMEKYFWSGRTVDIYFDYNEISKEGGIYYAFRPIQRERDNKR